MCDITPLFFDFCKQNKVDRKDISTLRNRKPKINKKENERVESSSLNLKQDLTHGHAQFLTEAYRILVHIEDLHQQLEKIKPAYLNVSRLRHKQIRGSTSEPPAHISDAERDEIDIQSKAVLNRCLQAIFRLEASEKTRVEDLSRKKPMSSCVKLFPKIWSSSQTDDLEWIAEMRGAITWCLNKKAMVVSDLQKGLQHARLARQLDRQETFSWKIPSEEGNPSSKSKATFLNPLAEEETYNFAELEPMQLHVLEKENKDLLAQFESSLQQVMQAEKSLMEISNMQTTLATHIELQAREAERLYLDAQDSNDFLGQGNQYLKSATSNAAQSRHFLFVFFLIASATLLFLDWYD